MIHKLLTYLSYFFRPPPAPATATVHNEGTTVVTTGASPAFIPPQQYLHFFYTDLI